ncbi:hypothetical protein F383_34801 [Gossypium arboreum]|uniref:Uncharacterized protein n=1 Tax=Gossypium arboreum TaxID=29729 RepID=A0A0B0PZ74_GOSAR|nr:hypothetical protein F383_34801 [Gossypium arboreum]
MSYNLSYTYLISDKLQVISGSFSYIYLISD